MAGFTNISKEKKFIFLHPMRNGGKSIELVLFNKPNTKGSADHVKPNDWIEKLGKEEWSTYFKFGFTRNPWDRMVSLYFYRKNNLRSLRNITFEQYLVKLKNNVKMSKTQKDKFNQHEWFYHDGNPIDFIGRFENYEEDFEKVKEILNLDKSLKLPSVNASNKRKPYHEMYNDKTKSIVDEMFATDIEIFNYKFGE